MTRCAVLLAAFATAVAQSPLVFEAATVKPNLSAGNLSKWDPDHHGNFKAENASLKNLIGFAYHVPGLMISGPSWIESLRYDVNAKGTPEASDSQVAMMMQGLLEERFRLRVHREAREMPVYFLEIANGGPKAPPADPSKPAPTSHLPSGAWSYLYMPGTLAAFAGNLSGFAGRPVIDLTGTAGTYHFELWFNNHSESDGPDLFNALREELGLRLRSGRDSVEILVVDNAEKVPVEN